MNRKRILILAAIIGCLALAAAGTTAYYAVSDTTVNIIQMGSLKMALHDETADGKPFPKDGIKNVFPDTRHDKVVYVENTGTVDLYARIRLTNTVTGEGGESLSFDPVSLELNTENWTEKDGWYYYNTKLAPTEKSEPLLTEVSFAPGMGNEYKKCKVDIVVTAQAVQSRNNGDDPLLAEGWPEEETADPDGTV